MSRPRPRGEVGGLTSGVSRPTPGGGRGVLSRPMLRGGSPQQMATAAGGRHPTGMHSCHVYFSQVYLRLNLRPCYMRAVNTCVFYFQLVDIGFGTIPDTPTAFMVSKADLKFSDNASAASLIVSKIDTKTFPEIYTRKECILCAVHETVTYDRLLSRAKFAALNIREENVI